MQNYLALETINNKAYGICPMPSGQGIKYGVKVGKILGPFLIGAATQLKSDINSPAFVNLVTVLFDKLDDPETLPLISKIMEYVECDGRNLGKIWEIEFAGKLDELMPVLKLAITTQFGGFLKGFVSAATGPAQ